MSRSKWVLVLHDVAAGTFVVGREDGSEKKSTVYPWSKKDQAERHVRYLNDVEEAENSNGQQ